MARIHVFETARSFEFPLAAHELWAVLQQVDHYREWWPWMRRLQMDRDELAEGTTLRFTIVTPIPNRMRVEVLLEEVQPARRVVASVRGDLRGRAELSFAPSHEGTETRLAWSLEVMQPSMRAAARVARPLLQWGHDWAIGVAAGKFGRYLERAGAR